MFCSIALVDCLGKVRDVGVYQATMRNGVLYKQHRDAKFKTKRNGGA